MDRINQLRGDAGGSRDSTLDSTSPPSVAYITANDSSKFFSLSEVDSTFEITPIKDVSLSSTTNTEQSVSDSSLIPELSPVANKTDMLDGYKIGKQIEAANILSGGVNIFEDNDNSYDGHELVIDDNVGADLEDKVNEVKLSESSVLPFHKEEYVDNSLVDTDVDIPSRDSEVVLLIDGKTVKAIDIGNGLYLYRKEGEEELAAVQIIDDGQHQPTFKFLKVRENAEGSLEVYEEIQIEVPKEVPVKEGKSETNISHVPVQDINKIINDPINNKIVDSKCKSPQKSTLLAPPSEPDDQNKILESKNEVNFNGKTVKFNELQKSPVIGAFTPMTYHSTPNKEGIPLTKIMVDQQLHPNRHSDNVKKTIEVHTDNSKQKICDITKTNKESPPATELVAATVYEKDNEILHDKPNAKEVMQETETFKDIHNSETENNISIEKSLENLPGNFNQNLKNQKMLLNEINAEKNTKTETNSNIVEESALENNKMNAEDINKNLEEYSYNLNNKCDKSDIDSMYEKNKALEMSSYINDIEISKNNIKTVTSLEKTITREKESCNTGILEIPDKTEVQDKNNFQEKKKAGTLTKSDIKQREPEKADIQMNINIASSESTSVDISTISVEIKENNNKDDNSESTSSHLKIQNELLKENCVLNITETSQEFDNKQENILSESRQTKLVLSSPEIPENKQDPLEHTTSLVSAIELEKKKIDVNIETNTNKGTGKNIANTLAVETGSTEEDKKDILKGKTNVDVKSKLVNSAVAVPFGKWTEANRQEFLNKIKESKIPTNSSNANQIKQPNDLNRRDVLKKIDSQRQSSMASAQAKANTQESNSLNKRNVKNETPTFSNSQESRIPVKRETSGLKVKPLIDKKLELKPKQELSQKSQTTVTTPKKETLQRKDINNQALIDKTIEEILNRPMSSKLQDDKQNLTKEKTTTILSTPVLNYQTKNQDRQTLDAIEMTMNELHGIPFVERPPHELPRIYNHDRKTFIKSDNEKVSHIKMPNLLPLSNKPLQKVIKDNNIDIDSDEEIIEHEPITGDINLNSKNIPSKLPSREKSPILDTIDTSIKHTAPKIETIITEKDFDKFARRNSITYENCFTVNFDGSQPHNVVQTVVEKDLITQKCSTNNCIPEIKTKSHDKHKTTIKNNQPGKLQQSAKLISVTQETFTKNYQSKVQIAYQSALTAKRQMESPITIIEDKPVKVVYMDPNAEIIPLQLKVHDKELSPTKSQENCDGFTFSTCDSTDSDMLDAIDEGKLQDEHRMKTKHQRKQVLTPVETPELELIEPNDLGIEISPKKKRKSDEDKTHKNLKTVVPKKSYLLGRSADNKIVVSKEITKNLQDTFNSKDIPLHTDTVSAIDNLVKAAELIETQSENMTKDIVNQSNDSPQNLPIKRGRGRPRKYPRQEDGAQQTNTNKAPSPQKKLRITNTKIIYDTSTDEESSDGEMVKENWTMGKINENIVCPICNKLFRSENVVFKHVRHCTGPSPNRSDSEKRSPRRRHTYESETKRRESNKSDDSDIKITSPNQKLEILKIKSKDTKPTVTNDEEITKYTIREKKIEGTKMQETLKTAAKTKAQLRSNNFVCEFCGKTFRQLSYLDKHKLQHKKEDSKQTMHDTGKTVFCCEVCKKEFRKLHHLVQHRLIHNQTQSRTSRKCSFEHSDKTNKQKTKLSEDQSAGFRCEPCDKSFRKLHHLVEHRETHDGINRQKNTAQSNIEKPEPPIQCEVCKKTFRKLHHLIEHKEQHLETSSEKSDDKSVKSALSKDIIHECSLCYMVFPNEHSLTKHTIICKKKRKQAAAKAAAKLAEQELQKLNEGKEDDDIQKLKDDKPEDEVNNFISEAKEDCGSPIESTVMDNTSTLYIESQNTEDPPLQITDMKIQKETVLQPTVLQNLSVKRDFAEVIKSESTTVEIPAKVKKIKENEKEGTRTQVVPKKSSRIKVPLTETKRQETINVPLPVIDGMKFCIDSSEEDEDEIRYMLNPDFKISNTVKGQLFINVKAKKRNSLQIERPNSKDLMKRRTSMQHPIRIPRLKSKPLDVTMAANTVPLEKNDRTQKVEPVSCTDSDDSEVKYSFPKSEKIQKSILLEQSGTDSGKKIQKKSLSDKRKSLTSLAQRKSLGKVVKQNLKPSSVKEVKKRTNVVEHRCDCGQLFSSAALLARHTTLAHTPPRRQRQRSPLAVSNAVTKPQGPVTKPKLETNKSTIESDSNITQLKLGTGKRKSAVQNEVKGGSARKSVKPDQKEAEKVVKARRNVAHRGVPVPDKMRKMIEKNKMYI